MVRTAEIANATILLVNVVKRHPHGDGMARLQHEVVAILMRGSGLAYAGRFVEVL